MQASLRRRGLQLLASAALALSIVETAAAAPPPTGPGSSGVQQYIETIPTATGAVVSSTAARNADAGSPLSPLSSTSDSSSASDSSGIASDSPSTASDSPSPASDSLSSAGDKSNQQRSSRASRSPSSNQTANSSGRLHAVVHAGSSDGFSGIAILAVVLALTTLGAIVIVAVQRRRRHGT